MAAVGFRKGLGRAGHSLRGCRRSWGALAEVQLNVLAIMPDRVEKHDNTETFSLEVWRDPAL